MKSGVRRIWQAQGQGDNDIRVVDSKLCGVERIDDKQALRRWSGRSHGLGVVGSALSLIGVRSTWQIHSFVARIGQDANALAADALAS